MGAAPTCESAPSTALALRHAATLRTGRSQCLGSSTRSGSTTGPDPRVDDGSRNGYINDRRVQHYDLFDNDVITLDKTKFKFKFKFKFKTIA
jgi:pSer/pThr/pTyr-binding forkhead associated (FHA) protein